MEPITLNEIVKWTDGYCVSKNDSIVFDNISTDSRACVHGCLFIALKGKNFDGHDFVSDAVKSGAKAVVVEKKLPVDTAQIIVPDTLKALGDIAKHYRRKFWCPVIGITGSDGKTTTKEMCAQFLSSRFNVCKNQGNFNNEIGLPLSIMTMTKSTEVGIFELGMNGYGQLDYLGQVLQPDIVIVTSIGYAHLGFFKNRKDLARTKAEVLQHTRPDGHAFINGDTNFFDVFNEKLLFRPVYAGLNPSNDFQGIIAEYQGDQFTFKIKQWQHINFKIKSWNGAIAYPSLFSILIADYFGVPRNLLPKLIYDFVLISGRGQVKDVADLKIFDESYNANPGSMSFALQYFAKQKAKRKIAVIGCMAELGKWSKFYHKKIAALVRKLNFDAVFTIGDDAEIISLSSSTINRHFENIEDMAEYVCNFVRPGDAILVKGSRVNKLEIVVQKLVGKQ
ncbi:MAG TPA: UDP-N-acetylmuramoyl-tripeptide--D-alanyl-D-alanine ligase [bacterium]|nr:UDP-N-acetylmuramoyl-tripeptide--D-alanyl-D-alanine ligase [bacterium]HOL35624.1 UDP-N-acetylmuramoyl-tripeptide--D-alanyl-D-alanine ligase [bacterium]HPP08491.1 UDP-N-acetylmuramoyl-tripeptide--D-alanyl-D-alanine ligase [bacterium]